MHYYKILVGLSMFGLTLAATSCYYDNAEDLYQYVQPVDCSATAATYQVDIVPVLESHCYRCHRNDRQDGNVNLEGYTQVFSYVENGKLYGSANHEPGFQIMPTSGVKIPYCDLELLRLWIAAGAPNN